jgi:hypothetical protein
MDGSTETWTVTVKVILNPDAAITGFSFASPQAEGIIDPAGTVSVIVPYGTDVTNLTPTITVPSGATISPGGARNFTGPVTYTVTPAEGDAETWTVTVTAFDTITTVAGLTAYLSSASGGATDADPVSLPVNINLAGTGGNNWAGLLTAIQTANKYVDLDLSACTMSGTMFDPGSANTGERLIVSLTLPDDAASITWGNYDNSIFKNFTSLKNIEGAHITTIGHYSVYDSASYAFQDCTSLETADFPEAINIGGGAFRGCTSLRTADIPKAETIGN